MTERRRDPLTGDWRTFASHRQTRTFLPAGPDCPLCPTRPGGFETEIPAASYDVVVFDNRFPSFTTSPPPPSVTGSALYEVAPARGAAEVIVYSDRHDQTMADLGPERIARIVDVWADRYTELGRRPEVGYVFVFENRGAVIGVTLDHPHGQIYGYPDIPPLVRLELDAGLAHFERHGTCVMCDIVACERMEGTRVVARNRSFLAFVPFAARFPYEVHVTAHRHAASLLDLGDGERQDLAELLDVVVRAYDALFGFPLPYVMAVHQAPTDDGQWQAVTHCHVEFTPIHRTADKLKYLAGSELAAGAFVNDTAPEATAAELRAAVTRSARRPPALAAPGKGRPRR
ncbi:MAG TPA: galactose-1-phosphate uridylyltransferase [Acidimicrobiales bacterium]|nr:galactose-1-phosphate uridylyltransferase [Acidimicrobiales bacterium]